jgi:uncharacterized protein
VDYNRIDNSTNLMTRKKLYRRLIWIGLIISITMNIVAFFHAYKFTHFTNESIPKTEAQNISTINKLKALAFGINNPRPKNNTQPSQRFETVRLQSNKQIECWHIKTDSSRGTVILFHGYGGQKSSLIDKSDEFIKLGFSTLLVDFMGSGGSEGNQTTIGFKEAEEVKTCLDYLTKLGEKNIYLFGTSLGAVAIMKSISDYELKPKGIIIECPFGSMYQTTCARFNTMKIPSFPMAGLLVFWGGAQNGFWAFGHKPTEYAKNISCPTLLLYGEKDEKVSRKEIDEIYMNLNGKKRLITFPLAAHDNYFKEYREEWINWVQKFVKTNKY